jgi:ribonuclease-3
MAVHRTLGAAVHDHPVMRTFEALETAIGHRFARPELLEEALTHPSAGVKGRHYERLEFLGDRVLGLIVATQLFESFPDEGVGDIANRYNALVRDQALVEIARVIELGQHIRLAKGERNTGGADRATILENALEALIGAVYLDAGFDAARQVVLRCWADRLAKRYAPAKDAKSRLGEWAQARGLAPPVYVVTGREGPDHVPRFTVEAQLAGRPSMAATGGSRREAEQLAAAQMLISVGAGDE